MRGIFDIWIEGRLEKMWHEVEFGEVWKAWWATGKVQESKGSVGILITGLVREKKLSMWAWDVGKWRRKRWIVLLLLFVWRFDKG